jgi:hypothetical protein
MKVLAVEARDRDIVVEVTIFSPYPNTAENYWWNSADWQNAWNGNFNVNGAFTSNDTRHFYPEFYNLNYGETTRAGRTLRDYQQALVDKVVAELGGYKNVYFEIANEFAVEHWGAPADAIHNDARLRQWQETWVQRIDSQSPRLVSVHSDTIGGAKGTEYWIGNGAIDVLNFRFANKSPGDISVLLNQSGAQISNKILAINESFGGNDDTFYHDLDKQTRYAWGMFVSGGHIAFYEPDARRIVSDPRWETGAMRLRVLRDIAESVSFWEMSPIDGSGNEYDDLITQGPTGMNRQVLANPGSQYVAYFWGTPTSTAVGIGLPTGSYDYSWHDVRNKNVLGRGAVQGSGSTRIPSPLPSSWNGDAGLALVIKRTDGNADPSPRISRPTPAAGPVTTQP